MKDDSGVTAASEPQPRVVRDRQGVPQIVGANTKVVEVVRHQRATGDSPGQIRKALSHLSLAQIEAALSFYQEHREEIDDDLERRAAYVDRLKEEHSQPVVIEEIRKLHG